MGVIQNQLTDRRTHLLVEMSEESGYRRTDRRINKPRKSTVPTVPTVPYSTVQYCNHLITYDVGLLNSKYNLEVPFLTVGAWIMRLLNSGEYVLISWDNLNGKKKLES